MSIHEEQGVHVDGCQWRLSLLINYAQRGGRPHIKALNCHKHNGRKVVPNFPSRLPLGTHIRERERERERERKREREKERERERERGGEAILFRERIREARGGK